MDTILTSLSIGLLATTSRAFFRFTPVSWPISAVDRKNWASWAAIFSAFSCWRVC
jgi:hypothetical protein